MKTLFLTQSILRFAVLLALLAPFARASAEVTSYEKQIIAAVLVLEAANQGEDGMTAVLHVINNRAGGNPERALAQVVRRKQFSCLNGITSQKHPDYGPAIRRAMNDRTWTFALQMVDDYVAGSLGPDMTYGATHYCIQPPQSWLEQMVYTRKIGAHHFFRES